MGAMNNQVVVVGGGMAGLGAALAGVRSGVAGQWVLLEQAAAFEEVGAGIQLGPNAVRVLHDWGLMDALQQCAAFPEVLRVRDAASGSVLGSLTLGAHMRERYGQPYATIHRADLHSLLLQALQQTGQVGLRLSQPLLRVAQHAGGVTLETATGTSWDAQAVLGCDGVRSMVRQQLWQDGPPVFSGHLAYRGMVRMDAVPQHLRASTVSAWLGRRLHVVHYPVRRGEWMNVVAVVHGPLPDAEAGWDHDAHATDLQCALGPVATDLMDMVQAVSQWRLWPLNAREPMRGPGEHARGRVALLGDAAHPMRPYLAQGAAMALEDAWTLGRLLPEFTRSQQTDWPELLHHWARQRWQRNAWVQARSQRNGVIFHAQGPLRWGRNLAMAALGEGLLDVPRLYAGPPVPQAAPSR
jgi:salicylate hydroxylase